MPRLRVSIPFKPSAALLALIVACALLLTPGSLRAAPAPLAHVETVGTGQTQLILIPGWMCDWTVWDEFMRRNAHLYTMRAVTLPGFVGAAPPGEDDTPPRPADETPWLTNAVAAVAQLIEDEQIDAPVVIGHSLGGQIAMRLAIERPELVGKVVTVDGMPAIPLKHQAKADRVELVENAYEPMFRAMSDEDWDTKFDRAVDNLVESEPHRSQLHRMFDQTEREPSVRYLVEALKTDITPQVERIGAPLLAIAAIEDCPEAPDAFAESICATWNEQLERVPDAQIVFIEHAKHFFFLIRTEEFDTAIARFVRGEPVVARDPPIHGSGTTTAPVKKRTPTRGVKDRAP